jgi:hydroxysqualene dehydroxylase
MAPRLTTAEDDETSMTKKIIIIGGGFAGLSAATALAEQGHKVTLLEGRQVLGGRAYSFADPHMGDSVDNGQHLFMGAYHETQNFLRRIGTLDRLVFQENLAVDFAAAGGRKAKLRCLPLPAPWHLISGLVRLSTLTWGDRLRMRHIYRGLKEAERNPEAVDQLTVEQWLIRWNQSDRARRHLWDLIAIATLNEDPKIASAAPFIAVLKQAFFDGRKNAQLGLSAVGLTDLYVTAAKKYVESRGGSVSTKSPVDRIVIEGNKAIGVQLREGTRLTADWVITAVTPSALLKLLPPALVQSESVFQKIKQLRAAPIISLHLWFDREITRRAFVGLLDTHVQWFFNRSKFIRSEGHPAKGHAMSLVISGAHAFTDWQDSRLLAMAMEELRRLFPKARNAILLRSVIIKEHQATLSPTVGSEALRPEARSPISGLLLAGDWTKTGLPATIESACISGHRCAEIITTASPATASPSSSSAVASRPVSNGSEATLLDRTGGMVSRGSTLQPSMDPPLTYAGDDKKKLARGMTEEEVTHA